MARTWREIPNSPYRDNDGRNPLNSAPLEEKKHPDYTKKVRDKDNHHCLYSSGPADWKRRHKRRYRSNVNDEIRKIEQMYWENPSKKVGPSAFSETGRGVALNIVLPDPKEFQPYYW